MHARTLRAIFRSALSAAALGACSPYGLEGNEPHIATVPPGVSMGAGAASLPADLCQRACIANDHLSVRSCHAATLVESGKEETRIVCDLFYMQSSSSSFIGPLPSGRAPSGLLDPIAAHDADSYFRASAQLEAASVIAFRRLDRDLRAHGAPASLRRRAKRAAKDEARHARAFRRLAKSATRVRVSPYAARSLEAIALENLVEGCVRETYAALVAEHQAEHALDPAFRRTMKRIARDETRHAALAWSVHRWALSKLNRFARARIARAASAAVTELLGQVASQPAVVSVLGIPREASLARSLFACLRFE